LETQSHEELQVISRFRPLVFPLHVIDFKPLHVEQWLIKISLFFIASIFSFMGHFFNIDEHPVNSSRLYKTNVENNAQECISIL
jgi:hypothetical protein